MARKTNRPRLNSRKKRRNRAREEVRRVAARLLPVPVESRLPVVYEACWALLAK